MRSVFAVSDLHVEYRDNNSFLDRIQPESDEDWLIVAGDVADRFDEIILALQRLRNRFSVVIWAPGNHELWSLPNDPVTERGAHRYRRLVGALRRIGVVTPEDPFPAWHGLHGPIFIAPLFLLYDYTFRRDIASSHADALRAAETAGVVCTDEFLLYPDPYPTRAAWCAARFEYTRSRLDAIAPNANTILVNHFPLVRQPTHRLKRPEFALWCGTERTSDWPKRYRAKAVVYGHLHIPVTDHIDGIPHYEVSLGYPHEWRQPGSFPRRVVRVLGPGGP